MEFSLEVGDARVRVDPEAGGRIASIEVAGLELLVPRNDDDLRWGCYPMAPFTGRTRNARFAHRGVEYALPVNFPPHAIHGTTFYRAWRREADAAIDIDLGSEWPFAGRARQVFTLKPDGLVARLEVHAQDEPFPASLGWHPWFRRELGRGEPAELSFRARSMYERDAEGIPSGRLMAPPEGPFDDCFTDLEEEPVMRWAGALRVKLSSSADHWVVYDEPAHAICVEPCTGPPNSLNGRPTIVAPDEPLAAEFRIEWEVE